MTKDIFFRGDIDFCNYSCSYCPFAKKTQSIDKIQKEEDNLKKLFFYLKNMDEDANIMITPYGEALIHPIYQVFIARLSTLDNVRKIGIQTNLSVDTKNLISTLEENKADFSKIMIWATFHSQFTDNEQFCNKANQLSKLISISCGIVANRKNFEEIKNLRQGLRPDIYLWINAMDKIKNKFTEDEISSLLPMNSTKKELISQNQGLMIFLSVYLTIKSMQILTNTLHLAFSRRKKQFHLRATTTKYVTVTLDIQTLRIII